MTDTNLQISKKPTEKLWDSNLVPSDYQSDALTAELLNQRERSDSQSVYIAAHSG